MDVLTMRASSLGEFADCPARWYAKHIEGLRTPSSVASAIGTAVHASTAAFDRARVEGAPITVDESAGVAVDSLRNPEHEIAPTEDDPSPAQAETIAIKAHMSYCADIAPQRTYNAVELDLGFVDIEVPEAGLTVKLTGHTDRRCVLPDGRRHPADLKTGTRVVSAAGIVDAKGHAYQIGGYVVLDAVNHAGLLEADAEVLGVNTKNGRTGVALAERPAEGLLGTEERPGLIQAAAVMARAGLFYGNPRSILCGANWCPVFNNCMFRK
jgi:RecB family exonuclease